MSPEQLEALQQQLPPFDSGAASPALLDDFCRFYGIDFAARMPGVSHRCGTIDSEPFTLAVHLWTCEGARSNLLLMHGYFDHTGLFDKLIGWALASGCNVLMFDLPGHGLSSGEPAVIDDFGHYSTAIHTVLGQVALPDLPLWAMGQSTGCAALTDFAIHHEMSFDALVLLAPLVRPAAWGLVRAGKLLLGPWMDSVPRKFSDNSSDRDFLALVRRDPLQARRTSLVWASALQRWLKLLPRRDLWDGPVQVVQGDRDGTVDWKYNLKVIARLYPHSRVLMLDGAGHQLANEAQRYRETYLGTVADFLDEHGIALHDQS